MLVEQTKKVVNLQEVRAMVNNYHCQEERLFLSKEMGLDVWSRVGFIFLEGSSRQTGTQDVFKSF